ncbi:MAG: ABC transporter permease [Ruminococcus sp.]|nr:ABC transporter permease [Ruminococcus sp.]
MNRTLAFSSRNIKELIRDPLGYIFCIGLPLIMLVIMTVIDSSIPKENGPTVFHIENLAPGVAVFGQTFVMLFTSITVATDRSGAFLMRLYATPMTAADLTAGYILPMLTVALVQNFITLAAGFIISLIVGSALNVGGMLLCLLTLMPSALMFIGFGLIFGVLLSEKSAPGVSSLIISLGSFLGGIWYDPDSTGGVMLTICKCLPFYYCTKSSRAALASDFTGEGFFLPLLIVIICAGILTALGCFLFSKRMRADLG